eukprot:CAMPEP_0201545796 /NCGR_PEP_ID=MMETSP0173_2-20130828/2219_1 /ASSEMBLY_ACC=CAM_ASM_000268 /TAXON_ID=218659 /ORGANISM="Vexillifera sp., Strain DIVA3 564/2" /LENGTH=55 /DNA_ID=CAMNT_0047954297 /DNA_START=511 /DNA_END=678 /DNA_ORIENTATION=+
MDSPIKGYNDKESDSVLAKISMDRADKKKESSSNSLDGDGGVERPRFLEEADEDA